VLFLKLWSGRADLNCRPSEPHSDALTRLRYAPADIFMIGESGAKVNGFVFNFFDFSVANQLQDSFFVLCKISYKMRVFVFRVMVSSEG
jgi:hypothetical protein